MRIVISGAHNTGKTTLIQNFLAEWPVYYTPDYTYRNYLRDNNQQHSSQTTVATQQGVLDFMSQQFPQYGKQSNVVFDRGPLDNLVYTLWAHAAKLPGFTDEYCEQAIATSRELLRHIDIIFITRYNPKFGLTADGLRDVTPGYVEDIDLIFFSLLKQYNTNYNADVFFPVNDSPVLIELPDDLNGRLQTIADYVDKDGSLIGETGLLDPKNLDMLEALVKQHAEAKRQETLDEQLFAKFKK